MCVLLSDDRVMSRIVRVYLVFVINGQSVAKTELDKALQKGSNQRDKTKLISYCTM